MRMNLNTNMELVGLREPYKATYKVSYKIPPYLTGLLAVMRKYSVAKPFVIWKIIEKKNNS